MLEGLVNVKRLALRALRARRCNFECAWTAAEPHAPGRQVLVGIDLVDQADAAAGARWAAAQLQIGQDARPVYIRIVP